MTNGVKPTGNERRKEIMEPARKLEQIDGQWFDPETGEVVDVMEVDVELIKTLTLPHLARQMRALQLRSTMIEEYRQAELNRIDELCDAKVKPMEERVAYLGILAKELYEQAGGEKKEYPGLGTFSTTKSHEYVDTESYDAMSDDEKAVLRKKHSGLFRFNPATVHPDKAAIKKAIKSDGPVEGFSIGRNDDLFTFKPEA